MQNNTTKKETIQDISIKLIEDQNLNSDGENISKESTIFILGSKGVGKTTLLNNFLDRNESPRPTLALEYSFGRRTSPGQGVQKEICNVWELGSLLDSSQLIEIPMRSHDLKYFSAVVVLDLSQPSTLWVDLECALNSLKRASESNPTFKLNGDTFLTKSRQRIGADHPDINTLELLPFPVVIVGGKYDLFQNIDPEIKKHVCRCLRSISHAVGSALIFYAVKHGNLAKTMRDVLNHLGFNSPANPFRKTVTDYNEAILIPFGGDSWEKIGVMPTNSERIGLTFNQQIPQQMENDETMMVAKTSIDPAKDPGFREGIIDELRSQKDDELLRLIRDTDMKMKFEGILVGI